MEELMYIQSKIHAPKEDVNQYGKYKYRKAEQILEAAKPYLTEKECTLVVSDDIVLVGNSIYVKATSTITNKAGDSVSAVGWAREADNLAGMSPGQVTGATSSYARKYSLCGLFAIDDTKDLDDESITNPHGQAQTKKQTKAAPKAQAPAQMQAVPQGQAQTAQQPAVPQQNLSLEEAKKRIAEATTREQLAGIYNANMHLQSNPDFVSTMKARKDEIVKSNGKAAA